jgi:hypothetical protein
MVDLLVLTNLGMLLFVLKTYVFHITSVLMRRSTVVSTTHELVSPDSGKDHEPTLEGST